QSGDPYETRPVNVLQRLRHAVGRVLGRSSTTDSARRYWKRKVAEESGRGRKRDTAPSGRDEASRESARKYWQREVADERIRRGTPDPPTEPRDPNGAALRTPGG